MRRLLFSWIGAVSLLALALPTNALPIAGARMVDSPDAVYRDAFEPGLVTAFQERESFVLEEDLRLDDGTVVAAGTSIDSYYIVFDPSERTWIETTLVFETSVLGTLHKHRSLWRTDALLGPDGASYTRFKHRGFEPRRDAFEISERADSIHFRVRANSPGDAMRVITVAQTPTPPPPPSAPMPEPTGAVLFGTGLLALHAGLRRRRG